MPTLACALDNLDNPPVLSTTILRHPPAADEKCFFCWRPFIPGPNSEPDSTCSAIAFLPCHHLIGEECFKDFCNGPNSDLCPKCRTVLTRNPNVRSGGSVFRKALTWLCGTLWYEAHEYALKAWTPFSCTAEFWERLRDGSITNVQAFALWVIEMLCIASLFLHIIIGVITQHFFEVLVQRAFLHPKELFDTWVCLAFLVVFGGTFFVAWRMWKKEQIWELLAVSVSVSVFAGLRARYGFLVSVIMCCIVFLDLHAFALVVTVLVCIGARKKKHKD